MYLYLRIFGVNRIIVMLNEKPIIILQNEHIFDIVRCMSALMTLHDFMLIRMLNMNLIQHTLRAIFRIMYTKPETENARSQHSQIPNGIPYLHNTKYAFINFINENYNVAPSKLHCLLHKPFSDTFLSK